MREYRALRRDPVFAGEGVPRGEGQPVMLVPGYLGSDDSMAVMARWLRRSGYRPAHSGMRVNTACAERSAERLEARLETLVEREGRRVAIVGHSRGGHFARVLAVRRPDLVSGIVTLAAPPLNPDAIHPVVRATAIGLTALGSLGAPGMMRWSCFIGECCEGFRDDLYAPVPDEVGVPGAVLAHGRDRGLAPALRAGHAAGGGGRQPPGHRGQPGRLPRGGRGTRRALVRTPTVAIVGAGMSGLCMGIKLKEAGIEDFTILEKADRLGGTWRDNTYPGLQCDVPSLYYQYSFDPNPDWSSTFSPGGEIRGYLEHVAEKHDLGGHIRFGAEVVDARFADGRWRVRTADGRGGGGGLPRVRVRRAAPPALPGDPRPRRVRRRLPSTPRAGTTTWSSRASGSAWSAPARPASRS